MTNTTNPTLRIHGPADLLTGVPYLLGFTPEESLVLIGLTHGVLVVTARIDLTDAAEGNHVPDTIAAMVRGGSNQFVLALIWIASRRPRPTRRCAPARCWWTSRGGRR